MNDPQTNRGVKRKRPWLPITSVLIVVWLIAWLILAYAPIYPYSLSCRDQDFHRKSLEGPFTKVFVDGFTGGLHHYDVNYLYYDGNILLQFSGLGEEAGNLRSDLRNVQWKFVRSLVDKDYGEDVDKLPEHIRKLAEESRDPDSGDIQEKNCALMRAVALEGW